MADKIPSKPLQSITDKYTVENQTFIQKVKDDSRDAIDVEIGDIKQSSFKPQVKIMRWDNEVNFSVRAEEKPDAIVVNDKDVIKYKTADYEIHQYDKPDIGEDGGFEFEWVFKKRPMSNILNTTIETKGLTFFKQEITQQQKDDWDWQYTAPNVEGSYAAYHSTKRNNIVGGKSYKTGKAFHIFRPEAIDASGNKVFCDLDLNIQKKTLHITVPQDFLDNALYPVIVDPTFGFDTIGLVTGSGTSGLVLGLRGKSPGEAGTLTEMAHYCEDSGQDNLQFGIYVSDGASKVENSGANQISSSASWITDTLTESISDQNYDLCVHLETDTAKYYHDSAATYQGDPPGAAENGYSSVSYGTWPASISWTNWQARLSIYATYTTGGAVSTPTRTLLGVGT